MTEQLPLVQLTANNFNTRLSDEEIQIIKDLNVPEITNMILLRPTVSSLLAAVYHQIINRKQAKAVVLTLKGNSLPTGALITTRPGDLVLVYFDTKQHTMSVIKTSFETVRKYVKRFGATIMGHCVLDNPACIDHPARMSILYKMCQKYMATFYTYSADNEDYEALCTMYENLLTCAGYVTEILLPLECTDDDFIPEYFSVIQLSQGIARDLRRHKDAGELRCRIEGEMGMPARSLPEELKGYIPRYGWVGFTPISSW